MHILFTQSHLKCMWFFCEGIQTCTSSFLSKPSVVVPHPSTHLLSFIGIIVPSLQLNTFHCGWEILMWYRGDLANHISFVQSEQKNPTAGLAKMAYQWQTYTTVLPTLIIMMNSIETSFYQSYSADVCRLHLQSETELLCIWSILKLTPSLK